MFNALVLEFKLKNGCTRLQCIRSVVFLFISVWQDSMQIEGKDEERELPGAEVVLTLMLTDPSIWQE